MAACVSWIFMQFHDGVERLCRPTIRLEDLPLLVADKMERELV
jgi:hypothetical protein